MSHGHPYKTEPKAEAKEDGTYNSFNSAAPTTLTPGSMMYMAHTGKLNMAQVTDPVTDYASSGVFAYQTDQSGYPHAAPVYPPKGRGGRGRGFLGMNSQRGMLGGGNRGRGRGRPGADMGADRGDGRNAIQTLQLRLKRDDTIPVYTESAPRLMNVSGAVITYTVEVNGQSFTAEGTKILHAKNAAAYKALENLKYDRLQHLKQTVEPSPEIEKIARVKESERQSIEAREIKEKMKLERLQLDAERRALKLQEREEKKAKFLEIKELEGQAVKKIKPNSGGSVIPANHVPAIEGIEHLSGIIDNMEQWQNIFGIFSQTYGPIELTSDWTYHSDPSGNTFLSSYTYNLICQGNTFTGNSINKKEARRVAAKNGMIFFKNNSPPIVNDLTKRKKIANRKTKSERPLPHVAIEDPFSEALAKMSLEFTATLMADKPIIYTNKLRELCVVVKVSPGADPEDVSNCEIVALGNGGAVCDLENITGDGSVINDCSGDTLAIRAFRRYLLGQVEAVYKDEDSIFVKCSDKLKLADTVSFRMIMARSPQGDAYVFPKVYRRWKQDYYAERRRFYKNQKKAESEPAATVTVDAELTTKPESTAEPNPSTESDAWILIDSVEGEAAAEPATSKAAEPDPSQSEPMEQGPAEASVPASSEAETGEPVESLRKDMVQWTPAAYSQSLAARDVESDPIEIDPGKVHWWMQRSHYQDKFYGYMLQVPSAENRAATNQIVSPCDKLLTKTLTGVQGGLLSLFIEPVYFTHYLVASSLCNQEALSRAICGRLEGVPCVKPQIARLRTHSFIKPDPSNPKKGGLGRSQYAHIWAKGSELDIIWPCLGKCIPLVRIPEKTDDPAELQLTWLKKELEGATPSSYNSLKFYQRFSELCKHHNIEVAASSDEMKRSAKEYSELKQSVKDKLEKDGRGTWPVKSVARKF